MNQIPQIQPDAVVLGLSRIGQDTLLGWGVIVGHPAKATLNEHRNFHASRGATVGDRCIIRSGTVIYEDAVLGNDVQTAHNVVVREGACIGDGCVFGSGCEGQIGARLGRNVRLQLAVMISENAELGNDIFIGPGVIFTGGRFMTAALERGNWDKPSVIVEDDVRIGANSVILAGVRLGKGCIVGAGSVVSADVPPGALVMGRIPLAHPRRGPPPPSLLR